VGNISIKKKKRKRGEKIEMEATDADAVGAFFR